LTKNNCIVTQIHIPPFDPQGSLSSDSKKAIIDLNISHLRKNNPDSCIILVGHGEKPWDTTTSQCDHVVWEDLYPIDSGGTVIGMPAQYISVSKGVKLAKELGFEYCLKVRGDSIISKSNIIDYCHNIIIEEGKKILLTQQTGKALYKFGDCFMYGEIDLIDSIWDLNNEPFHADGLRHTGASFVKHFSGNFPPVEYLDSLDICQGMTWNELLREYCSFRDISTLGFCDLRWNFNQLYRSWEKNREEIMTGVFDFPSIFWGKTNGWHFFSGNKFNGNGAICSWSYSEETFYGEK
tara:strand:+ start:29929 stop:30810 length:882 start_codon:yes stop_codon:yes gene_type:complete